MLKKHMSTHHRFSSSGVCLIQPEIDFQIYIGRDFSGLINAAISPPKNPSAICIPSNFLECYTNCCFISVIFKDSSKLIVIGALSIVLGGYAL